MNNQPRASATTEGPGRTVCLRLYVPHNPVPVSGADMTPSQALALGADLINRALEAMAPVTTTPTA